MGVSFLVVTLSHSFSVEQACCAHCSACLSTERCSTFDRLCDGFGCWVCTQPVAAVLVAAAQAHANDGRAEAASLLELGAEPFWSSKGTGEHWSMQVDKYGTLGLFLRGLSPGARAAASWHDYVMKRDDER